jgi:hypothetical protein
VQQQVQGGALVLRVHALRQAHSAREENGGFSVVPSVFYCSTLPPASDASQISKSGLHWGQRYKHVFKVQEIYFVENSTSVQCISHSDLAAILPLFFQWFLSLSSPQKP